MRPNENCELCEGTGIISMDDNMNYVHFADVECDCVKTSRSKHIEQTIQENYGALKRLDD